MLRNRRVGEVVVNWDACESPWTLVFILLFSTRLGFPGIGGVRKGGPVIGGPFLTANQGSHAAAPVGLHTR